MSFLKNVGLTVRWAILALVAYLIVPAVGIGMLILIQLVPPDRTNWDVHRGTVIDAATKRPIEGATLVSESGVPLQFILDRDQCRTNPQGVYSLRTKPDRTSNIYVRAKGYRTEIFWNDPEEPVRMRRALP